MTLDLSARIRPLFVANLRNSQLLRAIRASKGQILITDLFGPDLSRDSLIKIIANSSVGWREWRFANLPGKNLRMKFKVLIAAVLIALSSLAISAGAGMGGHGKQAGGMQQPMPNLMRIVKMHGEALNLDDDQNRQLTAWHEKYHAITHGKLDEIRAIRTEMQHAVIDGANRAQINGYIARMDALRDEIVSIKLQCRNNMREVLNDEQWQTLTKMYREKFM